MSNTPPFHVDCHCVVGEDDRISVRGGCIDGDCDCRTLDGMHVALAVADRVLDGVGVVAVPVTTVVPGYARNINVTFGFENPSDQLPTKVKP